jgi:hypothetical protein
MYVPKDDSGRPIVALLGTKYCTIVWYADPRLFLKFFHSALFARHYINKKNTDTPFETREAPSFFLLFFFLPSNKMASLSLSSHNFKNITITITTATAITITITITIHNI